jgi:hypothetical protein
LAQRNMEARVRSLLRRVNDPSCLARLPLAQALCEATNRSDAQEALRRVVEGAFRGASRQDELKQLLLMADFDGRLSRSQVAERLHQSRRNFHRHHARAVSILAKHVDDILKATCTVEYAAGAESDASEDPLVTLATLVSNVDPPKGAQLFGLCGTRFAQKSEILNVRASAACGREVPVHAGVPSEAAAPPRLLAIFNAQAMVLSGRSKESSETLVPALYDDGAGALEPELRFELGWLTFLRARHSGRTRDMEIAAKELRRCAHDRAAWACRALLAQAEACLARGKVDDAIELLDDAERRAKRVQAVQELAASGLLRADVALQRGDFEKARRYATGTYTVLMDHHVDAFRCLVTLSRACIGLERPWSLKRSDTEALAPASWDRIALETEWARHLNAEGATGSAHILASRAYETAVTQSYEGLASRAAAAVADVLRPNPAEAYRWRLISLQHLLNTGNVAAACDLFSDARRITAHPGFLDRDLPHLIFGALVTNLPQASAAEPMQAAIVHTFLSQLCRRILNDNGPSETFGRSLSTLVRSAPAFATTMSRFTTEATDVVRPMCVALACRSNRASSERRMGSAFEDLVERMQCRPHRAVSGDIPTSGIGLGRAALATR